MQFADQRVTEVFEAYAARHRDEQDRLGGLAPSEVGARRDEFLLPVGAEAAAFLHALVVARAPKVILELGTSYGYSTLFLADAARICGARLVTVDLDPDKQAYASDMLDRAGLGGIVEFRTGDAIAVVEADPGPFDFVFLDIWKDLYVPCFEAAYPKLSDEAIVATDNMVYPEGARESARALRKAINAKPDLQTTLLPIGQGIELTVKWQESSGKL